MAESGGDPYKTSIPATLFFEVVVKIIAFDIGANFAWAVNHPKVAWHSIELKGIRAHRQQQLLNYLESLSWVKKLDAAIYETPIAVGQSAKRSLWGIAGIIEATISNHGLPVMDVPANTIKLFTTGRGNAAKVDMIAAAQRMGYKGSNEHEADAFCLLKYAEANMERV